MPIKELTNGTKWTKAEYWKEKDLKGVYLVTYKIDGLRVIRGNDGKIYSRNSKECKHHLERFNFQDAEFYYKDWSTSSSILRSDVEPIPIRQDMFYELTQGIEDSRLVIGRLKDPNVETINSLLRQALDTNHEGIVLRRLDSNKPCWIKVVPTKFADIRINKIIEGNGKYKGIAGSIETNWGNVSSFKEQPDMGDIEFRRKIFLNQKDYIGKIIQVSYRELTEDRKLRFPSLVRIRDDKDYEDIEV